MRVRIEYDPDPEDGPDAVGLTFDLTDNFLVAWIDQFGTPQYTVAGIYEHPDVETIVQALPVDIE